MRLLELCQAIQERRLPFDISLYVVSGVRSVLDEAFLAAGVAIIYGKPGILGLYVLARECRCRRIEVLHVNASLAGGLYACAGWLAGVPSRYSHIRTIGDDVSGAIRFLKDSIYRPFLNIFSHRVAGVCEKARNFSRTPPRKWVTLYDGTHPAEAGLGASHCEFRVLFLGRFIPAKDPVRMISIFDRLIQKQEASHAALQMSGRLEEPLATATRHAIHAKDLANRVELTGQIDNPLDALRSSTVLALPSRREGLPGVVLEALAVGTPVVARDLPGVVEIAHHVKGVTLMTPEASDEDWAEALIAARLARRDEISASFAGSPFCFERHLKMMTELWVSRIHAHAGR